MLNLRKYLMSPLHKEQHILQSLNGNYPLPFFSVLDRAAEHRSKKTKGLINNGPKSGPCMHYAARRPSKVQPGRVVRKKTRRAQPAVLLQPSSADRHRPSNRRSAHRRGCSQAVCSIVVGRAQPYKVIPRAPACGGAAGRSNARASRVRAAVVPPGPRRASACFSRLTTCFGRLPST